VEAICIDRKVSGQDLQKKIDDLVSKGLLEKPQADLLHEERYIGNAALHEILPPAKQEIEDGLVNSGGADEYDLYTASPGGASSRKATKNDEYVRCS
jgi:hypothetical protein